MRLTNIAIENYKSLKDVTITPGQVSVIVGANASGKSNFADCLDFISEVYEHGLEVAVSRKGGYENIAFRRVRRSKKPIKISLCVELQASDFRYYRNATPSDDFTVRFEHTFSFVARGYSIRAEFEVVQERLIVSVRQGKGWTNAATIRRDAEKFDAVVEPRFKRREARRTSRSQRGPLFDLELLEIFTDGEQPLSPTELFTSTVGRVSLDIYSFVHSLQKLKVYQISPTKSREFGVPTPSPELGRSGGNLPAVIDVMKKRNGHEWDSVMESMRSILPELRSIDVDYTPSRTLGLFFKEEGAGKPWSVDEVSDGTIQTLALLVAIFDPTSNVLMVEEPENSVHPWVIRHIIQACRESSQEKQIIITTHSPIVMDSAKPDEMWVLWRSDGESRLAEFSKLDEDFLEMWQGGAISTFEYLDSGALTEAIPPAPSGHLDSEE